MKPETKKTVITKDPNTGKINSFVGKGSTKNILSLISGEEQRIKHFDISGTDLFTKESRRDALKTLFGSSYCFEEINLSGCRLGELSQDDLRQLVDSISKAGGGIKKIDLSDNGFDKAKTEILKRVFFEKFNTKPTESEIVFGAEDVLKLSSRPSSEVKEFHTIPGRGGAAPSAVME